MIGERPPSADLMFGWWYAGSGYDKRGSGDVVLGVRDYDYPPFFTSLNCSVDKVGLMDGNLSDDCDQTHFWSLHAGGANFVMADGSVHFITYESNRLMPALATRAGGDIVEEF